MINITGIMVHLFKKHFRTEKRYRYEVTKIQ